MGELVALSAAFCWTLTSVFFFFGGKAIGSMNLSRIRLVLAVLFLMISHLFIEGSPFPYPVTTDRFLWLSASGIIGLAFGDSCLFKALLIIGPRLSTLMMASVPIFSSIIAWSFLNETLTGLEIFAIALTIGGIAWVILERSTSSGSLSKKQYVLGLLLGLGGAAGQAVGLIAAKKGLTDGFSPLSGTLIRLTVAMVFLWGMALLNGTFISTIKAIKSKKTALIIAGGSITGGFLGVWLSLIAIDLTRIGIAATLMAMTPIMIIPIAKWGLKETISIRTVIGTCIAITGVALIFLY